MKFRASVHVHERKLIYGSLQGSFHLFFLPNNVKYVILTFASVLFDPSFTEFIDNAFCLTEFIVEEHAEVATQWNSTRCNKVEK